MAPGGASVAAPLRNRGGFSPFLGDLLQSFCVFCQFIGDASQGCSVVARFDCSLGVPRD